MSRITEEHVKDVYEKFRKYFEINKETFFEKKQKHIVEEIKQLIEDENKFEWNEASLSDYINDLIYMLKGQQFARTINSFAEKYLIERICQDFGEIMCFNAKESLRLHKEYYQNIIKKDKNLENKNTNEIKKDNSSINTKNIILYGVPGVGKTHNINRFIRLIERNENSEKEIFKKITQNSETNEVLDDENLKNRVVFTTFHQSFAYEDFIEGFRPNKVGQIILRDGIFKIICDDARKDREKNYYLVIDEINRGNISKIFGELITLIEESKRDKLKISLPYSQEKFTVPSNLFIIGTMNSTDKSIALIDIALRRRFTFLELKPNKTLIKDEKAKDFFIKLNNQLEDDYKIGHSYFMGENVDLDFLKEYKIKPLLKEYFYGNSQKLNELIEILELGTNNGN